MIVRGEGGGDEEAPITEKEMLTEKILYSLHPLELLYNNETKEKKNEQK